MPSLNGDRDAVATNGHGNSAADHGIDGKSAADDADWFRDMARALLPTKAGTAFHCITGFDERLCQRYAAGHVRPPAYFFRALLRSKQGWQFLCGAMDGCDAPWWRELQRARNITAAIDRAEGK